MAQSPALPCKVMGSMPGAATCAEHSPIPLLLVLGSYAGCNPDTTGDFLVHNCWVCTALQKGFYVWLVPKLVLV